MTPLSYVGLAYACVWVLIFAYIVRLTWLSRRLAEKLDELEREASKRTTD